MRNALSVKEIRLQERRAVIMSASYGDFERGFSLSGPEFSIGPRW